MRYYFFFLFILNLPPQYFMAQNTNFDWQGHRGARGLLPENTIPAFLKALDLGVTTLELDLAVSADSQLIVSHEPWLSHEICSRPDGKPVASKKEADSLKIWHLTAAEIAQYDCGSRGNKRFAEQQAMATHKPTLTEMVEAVKKYCGEKKRPLPYFNIEIKSDPKMDGIFTPSVSAFVKLTLDALNTLKIKDVSNLQSFDPRALEEIHKMDKTVRIALLVENLKGLTYNLGLLTFKPDIYSAYFKLITKGVVKKCHKKGIKVIPWTVNEVADMKAMMDIGVDGIITDYPNRAIK
jgi:glycerophosphoryl diester phosphodiesterase